MTARTSTTEPTALIWRVPKLPWTFEPTHRASSGLPVHMFNVARIMAASKSTRRQRDFLRRSGCRASDAGCDAVCDGVRVIAGCSYVFLGLGNPNLYRAMFFEMPLDEDDWDRGSGRPPMAWSPGSWLALS